MMGLSNGRTARLIGRLLFLCAAACLGVADLSRAATIGYIGTGAIAESAVPASATFDGVEGRLISLDRDSGSASGAHSIPEFQTGGLNAITRALLPLGACACSSFRHVFDFSGPVSTGSTAPVMPAPAVPGTMVLFMIGLVTVAGVARKPLSRLVSTRHSMVQLESACHPRPGYILLVSNQTLFMQDLAACFLRYGYAVESVHDTTDAGYLAARQAPALVLVDRRQSGWQMLRRSAGFEMVPIMTVVPAGPGVTEETCLDDLECGMDSTHVCDGNQRLLVAKVRALLRRSAWLEQTPTVIREGQVELDVDRCEVRVAGHAHHLPPVQFKLLKYLMESPGKVFRRQEILDHIWGEGYAVEGHTLDVHICWLRRLLAHDPFQRQTITTIRGVGIKFVVDRRSDDTTGICGAWSGNTALRRSRVPQRRVSRRLRVVKSVTVQTAV